MKDELIALLKIAKPENFPPLEKSSVIDEKMERERTSAWLLANGRQIAEAMFADSLQLIEESQNTRRELKR